MVYSHFIYHHPFTLSFVSGLKNDVQRHKSFFLQGVSGVGLPSTKRYRKLNDGVKRAVAAYGRAEILE